jgi:uncharacterized cupin superfamily protein
MNLRGAELTVREMPAGFEHSRASVREALGGELIGCSIYEIPAGKRLWPYHYHLGNEEWLIVVTGTPTLRTPDGERELVEGDVVAFVEGEAGAHTLTNATEEPVRVAIFSTLHRGSVVYPDSGKVGTNFSYFRLADAVDYWDGEAD